MSEAATSYSVACTLCVSFLNIISRLRGKSIGFLAEFGIHTALLISVSRYVCVLTHKIVGAGLICISTCHLHMMCHVNTCSYIHSGGILSDHNNDSG